MQQWVFTGLDEEFVRGKPHDVYLFCFMFYGVILIPKCSMPPWFFTWKQQRELQWTVSMVPIAFRCNLPPLWCKITSRLAPIISSNKMSAISLHTGRLCFLESTPGASWLANWTSYKFANSQEHFNEWVHLISDPLKCRHDLPIQAIHNIVWHIYFFSHITIENLRLDKGWCSWHNR